MCLIKNYLFGLFIALFCTTSFAFAGSDDDNQRKYDFAPDFADSVIFSRINTIDSDIPIVFNDKVRSFIDYFSIRNRDYARKMLVRKNAYFPIFEDYLAKHDMPEALKYLTIVESGMNPKAKSRAGAMGLWQFMPSTGKMYGLSYDWYVDEKMDPYKATEAACQFLKQLHKMFDDWELALAAYNCGPGNVRKAIKRSGYKRTFWEIYPYLPRETRSYVPQFHAVNYLMRYAPEHNLFADYHEYTIESDTLVVNQYFNVKAFCDHSGICLETMELLNPEIIRNVIPEHKKNYVLRVPKDKMAHIQLNLAALLDSSKAKGGEELNYHTAWASSSSTAGKEKTYHYVRSGDVLGKISERYGVSMNDLRAWNNINSSNTIYVGQKLAVYKDPAYFKKSTPKPVSAIAKTVELPDNKIYTVQEGDTLWSISKKYDGLTIEQIKKLNNLTSDNLKPGQKLKLS